MVRQFYDQQVIGPFGIPIACNVSEAKVHSPINFNFSFSNSTHFSLRWFQALLTILLTKISQWF